MQKAEPQHSPKQAQPAARQAKGMTLASPQGEQIAQLEAMADASPQVDRLAQFASMANNNPSATAQRRSIADVHNSPHATAQRQQLDALTGVTAQRVEDEEPLQGKFETTSPAQREEAPAKPNNTGLPDNLKSGIESLSGMSMDNVRVHYNSPQPAQLNAHAYAQGTDIHVAPGQEQHLPHEAWHVVQQAQGRVQPTMQMKENVPVNDDHSLEHEADVMGAKAMSFAGEGPSVTTKENSMGASIGAVQRWPRIATDSGNFKYTLGWDFVERHIASSKDEALAKARQLYNPNHREGSHNAYVTVIYGDVTELQGGTDVSPSSPYHWAINIDVNAVCMGPRGIRGANGDPGQMDENITTVIVSGYGTGTSRNPRKITHVSSSI